MTQALFNFIGALIWLVVGVWLVVSAYRAGNRTRGASGWTPGFILNAILAALFALAGFVAFAETWVGYGKMLEVCR